MHGIPLSPQGQGQGQGQGPCRCAIWNPWVEHFKRYEEMSKFFYISRSRSRSRSRSMQTLNISTRSSHHGLYTCAIWNPWVEYFKRYEEMSKFFYISRSRSRSRSRLMQTLNMSTRSNHHGLYTCAIWNP